MKAFTRVVAQNVHFYIDPKAKLIQVETIAIRLEVIVITL